MKHIKSVLTLSLVCLSVGALAQPKTNKYPTTSAHKVVKQVNKSATPTVVEAVTAPVEPANLDIGKLRAELFPKSVDTSADTGAADPACQNTVSFSQSANIQCGLAKYTEGQLRTSIERYTMVINQEPNNAIAHNNRGVAKHRLKDYRGAVADYRRALAIKPDYVEAENNIKALEAELDLLARLAGTGTPLWQNKTAPAVDAPTNDQPRARPDLFK